MKFRLSARARKDLHTALKYSLERHGRDAADRYRLLLTAAIEDVAQQPLLAGSRAVNEATGIRCYAIARSRLRVARDQQVRRPTHQLVYRISTDGIVDILSIIGDSYPPELVTQE